MKLNVWLEWDGKKFIWRAEGGMVPGETCVVQGQTPEQLVERCNTTARFGRFWNMPAEEL